MENNFNIQIEDENNILSQIAVEEITKNVELFDWQRRAIEYFKSHNKCLFEVTTGAGKTFFTIHIIKQLLEENPNFMVLIVVPKNVILERTWYPELYNAGVHLKDIGVFYGMAKEYCKISITNMQSIEKINLEIFDVIVFDEIHNYYTDRLKKYIEYPFKYKIGLSATLDDVEKRKYKILSAFDYNIFKYTPQQALQEGILNPFNFTNISIEMDSLNFEKYTILTQELNMIMKQGGGYSKIMKNNFPIKLQMLKKLDERKKLVLNYKLKFEVMKEIALKHKEDKILVFNEYNEQTTKCYWHLLDIGIGSRVMHSGITSENREKNLTDFKTDKINCLVTTRILDEGYNVPKIDCALIMAGNSTAKQTIQRLGRVLRRKNKVSNLYQLYIKNTMEEKYALDRAKLFKELCLEFNQIDYQEGDKLF